MVTLLLLLITPAFVGLSVTALEVHIVNNNNHFGQQLTQSQDRSLYSKQIADDLYTLNKFDAFEFYPIDQPRHEKCHGTLRKVIGCVNQGKYRLHHVPFKSEVRHSFCFIM